MHRETIHYRISLICGNIPIFLVAQQPYSAVGRPLLTFVDHTQLETHHSRQDFTGRVISQTQWLLPDNTQTHSGQINVPGGIRTRNTRKPAASDPRFSPRGNPITNVNLDFVMEFQG